MEVPDIMKIGNIMKQHESRNSISEIIEYTSQIAAWIFGKRGRTSLQTRYLTLGKRMNQSRKLMRLGEIIKIFPNALDYIFFNDEEKEIIVKIAQSGLQIAKFIYFFMENIYILADIEVLDYLNPNFFLKAAVYANAAKMAMSLVSNGWIITKSLIAMSVINKSGDPSSEENQKDMEELKKIVMNSVIEVILVFLDFMGIAGHFFKGLKSSSLFSLFGSICGLISSVWCFGKKYFEN